MDGSGFDDFNIDKQEYQSVFKVFDKGNTGEINITQVYDLINKFEQASKKGEVPGDPKTKMPGMPQSTEVSPNVVGGPAGSNTTGATGTLRSQGTVGGANFSQKV